MAITSVLNQQATIHRKALTYSDSGEPQTAWMPIAVTVACAVEVLGRRLWRGAGGWISKQTARAFFEPETDLRIEDRLIVGGETYLVAHVADAAGRGHHLEALLVKPL